MNLRRHPTPDRASPRRGFALVAVMLVVLVVAAMATSTVMMGSNHILANRTLDRAAMLQDLAEEGLELGRAVLNADESLYPGRGYATLATDSTLRDGIGTVLPGVTLSVYGGPEAPASRPGAPFGSLVAVVEDASGPRAVRRIRVVPESFARFAYFTDIEPPAHPFGDGVHHFGPVHTNGDLTIDASGAVFHQEARAGGSVHGASSGIFRHGYEEGVARIDLPSKTILADLARQARGGGMTFSGSRGGPSTVVTFRIEFVAVDLDEDGDVTGDDEGFLRAYVGAPGWVTAAVPAGGLQDSHNCGDIHEGRFRSAADHRTEGHGARQALASPDRRCFLGGDPRLTGGVFTPLSPEGRGRWLPWPGSVSPALEAAVGPTEARYLHPLGPSSNPGFTGVVFVDGAVAVSGTLRGRVTLAASEGIVVADDLVYATDPGAGIGADVLGLVSGEDVLVADNAINTPQRAAPGERPRTYDDTADEFLHAIVFALNVFGVEHPDAGPTAVEPCETTPRGRGCLYVTGGVVQRTRGAVGSPGGTGYSARYSYDALGADDPPPHFPTTGRFRRAQIYDVDPAGFDVAEYFALLGVR